MGARDISVAHLKGARSSRTARPNLASCFSTVVHRNTVQSGVSTLSSLSRMWLPECNDDRVYTKFELDCALAAACRSDDMDQ